MTSSTQIRCPRTQNAKKIRQFLAGPQQQLADLANELARLDALWQELSDKQQRLEQFVDAHLALVSPVRRLPEDVMRAIFTASLSSTRNPAISADEAPLLLCRICKSWRSIALSTPRLWAAIHIVVPDPLRLQRLANWLVIWFERSGVVPLHISMVFSRTSESSLRDISPILSALTAVARRWRDIELPLPGHLLAGSRLLSLSPDEVPLLEKVNISQYDESTMAGSAFLATESLRSLTIPATLDCRGIPVSWRYLRHLNITQGASWGSRFTCPVALAVLRQCTALQTCEFGLTDIAGENDLIPTEEFSLPQLRHLSITRHDPMHRSHLFGAVTLPNLESLHYEVRNNDQSAQPELPRLLPSTPSLQSFTIQAPGLGSESLLEVLSHLPTLKNLAILAEPCKNTDLPFDWSHSPMEEKFLDRLSLGSATVICPLLESIQLQNFHAASDETLFQFIRSRTRPPQAENVVGCRLSRVAATFRRGMQWDIIPHLQDAVAGGLVVSLKYASRRTKIYSPLEGTNDFNNYWNWDPDNWDQHW
ncbi:F-box domain-containing protein [Mycena venus]|uniref:F-box domain-containing protein n=1 Tax=Mycena venus TaxID=2733690 RepID=A0A8H6Y4M4_9AGAR|nr:F-box domain-containing protein [Mycena venus]